MPFHHHHHHGKRSPSPHHRHHHSPHSRRHSPEHNIIPHGHHGHNRPHGHGPHGSRHNSPHGPHDSRHNSPHGHRHTSPRRGGYPGYPGGNYPGGNYPGGNYPGGSYPGGPYPGGSYPGRPGSPGSPYRRSPSPVRFRDRPPFTPDFDTYRGRQEYERGPYGPGRYPSQSGYGWFPPAHCTGTFSWVEGRNGSVPHNAVKVGVDRDGGSIFAGRAFYEGDLLPAKIAPHHGCAFVPWGGREHQRHEYEVLCSVHVGWTTSSGGDIPSEAIAVGQTASGERLYMGRVMHEGTLTPGKVQPSHGVLYIPYAGMEISYRDYEVMVLM